MIKLLLLLALPLNAGVTATKTATAPLLQVVSVDYAAPVAVPAPSSAYAIINLSAECPIWARSDAAAISTTTKATDGVSAWLIEVGETLHITTAAKDTLRLRSGCEKGRSLALLLKE